MALATRSLKLDLQPSCCRHLQFDFSSHGTEYIIMKAYHEFDTFFADGINAFNSAGRVQSRLFHETYRPEACSFIYQFYGGPPSDIWHTLNPRNISSMLLLFFVVLLYTTILKTFSVSSHIFRAVPPRLTLHFAQQANSLCYRIFPSMLSYLRIQLSPVHLKQLHLNIDDGGSSLPVMCLIQQRAYIASFTQCLPSILEVLNTISLISSHSLKPKLQRFLYGICYKQSLQSFQLSLLVLNDPIRIAHYYTLIGKDSSRWKYLIPKFGLYTMSGKDYQSALARRFYLPQPQIPSGLPQPRSPIINQVDRHFTTGCPLRGVRQASSNSIFCTMLAVVRLLKTATFFARMMRLKADIRTLPF